MKTKLFFLSALLLPMLASAYDYDVQIDGIYYYLYSSNKTAEVKGGGWGFPYTPSYSGEITIPSEVTYNDVIYNVTIIGPNAFQNCTDLNSVPIPNSVTTIGGYAFEGCSSLTSVTIPNSVTNIGDFAFSGCAFTSLTIPNSVTTIGAYAFGGCANLSTVTIGNSIVSISSHAFSYCPNFTDVMCLAETIPTAVSDIFQESNIENATLHVPAASLSAYQTTEPWSSFKEIVALAENDTDDSDYLPFVEEGKEWHVVRSTSGPDHVYEVDFYLPSGIEEIYGNNYYKMKVSIKNTVFETYLLREEDRKIYIFDDDTQKEYLVFDYSLKEGDTYETYSYEEQKMVTYKVLSVGDYTEGPQVKCYRNDEQANNGTTQYRYLRKWTVCRTDNEMLQKTWIEGVGSLEGPLANLYDERPISSVSYLAYVQYNENDYLYLPFTINDEFGQVHGCNLPKGKEDYFDWEDWHHQLSYELEGDRLHVYGKAILNCGLNYYACFIEEQTDDPLVRKLHFEMQGGGPSANCMGLYETDFYVSGFDPNINYIVVDNLEEEHPVINKTQQMVYRPFVEEGKVWVVKVVSDGWPTEEWIEYYYFDGDTIVDGQAAKRMLCDRTASRQDTNGEYVGAWYEQDKKVYFAGNGKQQFELLYDFTLSTGDKIQREEEVLQVTKMSGSIPGFKGTYYDFGLERWFEGVGSKNYPWLNFASGWSGAGFGLLICRVGDEILYYNSEEGDPFGMGAKKGRFDFTHTVKEKPRAPMRDGEERPLYGEYNELQLCINLNPLDDAYSVRITDETGKTVYEKAVNAGNIVGLNIDISAYTEGRYTVTMENSHETYTGEFEVQTTGISLTPALSQREGAIYNLQGQRLKSLQKGLNIVNGRKIVVK